MFCLFLTSSIFAVRVGRYDFPVERLTLNGTSYIEDLGDEMLYFNYLAPVPPPKGCRMEWDPVAVAVASEDLCVHVGDANLVEYELILNSTTGQPRGIRTFFEDNFTDESIVFDIICSRVEKRIARRPPNFQYLVTWHHPAGCPRLASTKVDRYTFPVEQLTLNGTNYKEDLGDEIFHFNYLAPVVLPPVCSMDWNPIAVAVVDETMCFNIGQVDHVEHELIMNSTTSKPKGIRSTFMDDYGAMSVEFNIMCSRVEKRIVRRLPSFDYQIVWQHPAGCPRLASTKSSRFDRF
ncbi:hypothetical protein BLNAU_9616 [Blattamonas nauphoetae]|uniref:Uncharacterized protein n=1 Tax=Blattamonas nauphoetae TaxID=2049346 RepID=A0ABQ9XV87_9EUKA|nr:hypothetical protein BLNAU_9616 [Blattamonas nauphoetae]